MDAGRSWLVPSVLGLVAGLLVACQTAPSMLPGNLYAARTGHALEFSIQKSNGHGAMEARDPATGETFSGEYSGFYTGQGAEYGHVGNADVALMSPRTGAHASGILVGDKGTTIRLTFEIKPGRRRRDMELARISTATHTRRTFNAYGLRYPLSM